MAGKKEKTHISLIARVVILVFVISAPIIGSIFLLFQGVSAGTASAKEAYSTTLAAETEKTAQEYYHWAFGKAEDEYHVSNRVSITVDDIKEVSRLEVLKVSDVEFIIQNADESKDKVEAWIAVPGDGVFTVDMTMSEFLIDNIRHIVVARIPQPKLTQCGVNSEKIEIYRLEKEGWIKNGNYAEGTALAQKHLQEGKKMIEEKFNSDQQYFLRAQKSAEILITNWIKGLNPEVRDLEVVVEFVDE